MPFDTKEFHEYDVRLSIIVRNKIDGKIEQIQTLLQEILESMDFLGIQRADPTRPKRKETSLITEAREERQCELKKEREERSRSPSPTSDSESSESSDEEEKEPRREKFYSERRENQVAQSFNRKPAGWAQPPPTRNPVWALNHPAKLPESAAKARQDLEVSQGSHPRIAAPEPERPAPRVITPVANGNAYPRPPNNIWGQGQTGEKKAKTPPQNPIRWQGGRGQNRGMRGRKSAFRPYCQQGGRPNNIGFQRAPGFQAGGKQINAPPGNWHFPPLEDPRRRIQPAEQWNKRQRGGKQTRKFPPSFP